jgi:hypothetical protein
MWNESHQTDRIFTELADSDAMWGPFLFLRPKPTEYLSVGRIVTTAALVGVPQGLVANLGLKIASRAMGNSVASLYTLPLMLTLLLALLLYLLIGRAWNRRVARLERAMAWRETTQRLPQGFKSHL